MDATDSTFIPMYLDSSPLDGPSYAELWNMPDSPHPCQPDLVNSYQPTRVSFYPVPGDMSLSFPLEYISRGTPPDEASSYQQDHQVANAFLGSPEPSSPLHQVAPRDFHLSSPSHLELPPPLAEAQFISDLPTPEPLAVEPVESPLPPSDLSGFSWYTSVSRMFGSDDVPQASFTLSPNDSIEDRPFREPDDDASDAAAYSSLYEPVHHILLDEAERDDVTWDTVYLVDFLDELFEHADPWSTLSDLLELPHFPVALHSTSSNLLDLLQASDRSGVGYEAISRSADWQDCPTSQTLAEETSEHTSQVSTASVGNPPLVGAPPSDGDPPSSQNAVYVDAPTEAEVYLPEVGISPLSPVPLPSIPLPPPAAALVSTATLPDTNVQGSFPSITTPKEDANEDLGEKYDEYEHASFGTVGVDAYVSTVLEPCDGPSLFADDDLVDMNDD
ncbi:hypothetical protein L227DRAFT_610692 [Lentinus tigrinus ALCF2SS1-6]|uniref:Uncharacterized protein n=1 Tax=Lentinus tigrinus ALCF2SS1-6 TaxID=1328759 RepID=A0A5C2SBB5_9APHY|nr:hypothetical protein L227DRAFT_610692 [Lentinus tigrinus ALCF2SS1-6]